MDKTCEAWRVFDEQSRGGARNREVVPVHATFQGHTSKKEKKKKKKKKKEKKKKKREKR